MAEKQDPSKLVEFFRANICRLQCRWEREGSWEMRIAETSEDWAISVFLHKAPPPLLSLPEQNQAARHSPPLHLGLRCLIEDAPSLTWDIHIAGHVVHLACTIKILWMKSLKFHIYGVKCCNWCAFFYENLNILENFPRVKRLTNVMLGPSPESDCVKVLYWIIFKNWFR